MKNKPKIALAVAAIVLTIGLAVWFLPYQGSKNQEGIEETFAEALGRPVNLASWNMPEDILLEIGRYDEEMQINYIVNVRDLEDLDVIVIFADGWGDSLSFPFAEVLNIKQEYFDRLLEKSDEFTSEIAVTVLNTSTKTDKVIYTYIVNTRNLNLINSDSIPRYVFDGIMRVHLRRKEPVNLDNYRN